MAKILKGILGGISGKVANVVGGRWKTTDYIRSWVIPANPQSALQVIQRDKMTLVVGLGRKILGSIINTYWDPFVTAQSGFNRFIQLNIKLVEDPIDYLKFLMSSGKLLKTLITSAVYVTGTGVLTIVFPTTIQGNQLATDKVMALCYSDEEDLMWLGEAGKVRSDGTLTVATQTGLDETKMSAYLFLWSEVDSKLSEVSDSTALQVTA